MKHPWQVWLAFLVCGAVLVAAMGWLTVHAARVDRERSAARAEALLEQRVSLALWRMDTKLAPLIAEEIARPHTFYEPFIALNTGDAKSGVEQVPSPLLTSRPENVLLNFTCPTSGEWSSPQCPPLPQRELAVSNGVSPAAIDVSCTRLAELSSKVDVNELIAQLPAQPLPTWALAAAQVSQSIDAADDNPFGVSESEQLQREQQAPKQQEASVPAFLENYGANAPALQNFGEQRQEASVREATEQQVGDVQQELRTKIAKGVADLGERSGRLQQAAQQEFSKFQAANSYLLQNMARAAEPVVESVSRPLWVGDQLLLARRVERGGQTYVQGSWLDWPRLKGELLAETADLLPHADLTPVRDEADAEPTRMLAALPVQLAVGDAATALRDATLLDGPLQWALGFGWAALLAALAAVAGLLWGVLALSERRAAFVSSVTHELRTPLTTFRMYTEMLARDMVPSPQRRREYLDTLKTEAERLTHLVENVLSYARLERGRRPQRTERTTPRAVIERIEPRLAERAARAEMQLITTIDDSAKDLSLLTDVGAVEQVLFNLVDNAAKYAARAADRRILLEVAREGAAVVFRVADHGPGFASLRAAERSAPFSKSAQEAAETAPGVGLGLALCRRLARELGGRLELASRNGRPVGASVALRL
ncbi:MAG TPA: HAMP domain-containing sensor histidine kinase, partial [Lacipirellula sp.]